jgi:hypothetical protein
MAVALVLVLPDPLVDPAVDIGFKLRGLLAASTVEMLTERAMGSV